MTCLRNSSSLPLPWAKLVVAQNDTALALLNRFPYTGGHLLIIPKRHVAEMEALRAEGVRRVLGYEANGGVLLGYGAERVGAVLEPLPTRDAMLPLLAPLCLARERGRTLRALRATLPARHTATGRLSGIRAEVSVPVLERLARGEATEVLNGFSPVAKTDRTDGLRMHLESGAILHLRPSGNAPELRIYAEAESEMAARDLLARTEERLSHALGGAGAASDGP